MNTNRLSKTLASALNSQMTKEALASQIYLSYAAWASNQGFEGIANFLFRHAHEERRQLNSWELLRADDATQTAVARVGRRARSR